MRQEAKTHELKLLPQFLDKYLNDDKDHIMEARKNDRNYQIGDDVILKVFTPEKGYTDIEISCHVVDILGLTDEEKALNLMNNDTVILLLIPYLISGSNI